MSPRKKAKPKTDSLVTRGKKRAEMSDAEIRIENSKLFGGVMGYAHSLHYAVGVMVEDMIKSGNQCGIVSFSLKHGESGTDRRITLVLAHGDDESDLMHEFFEKYLSQFNEGENDNG
jgi:uncharacterized protein YrzB (UPF0473 family)